jgi:translation initiation factor 3 subunit H
MSEKGFEYYDDVDPPVREVVIDGLAVMKIVKHCNENLPTMVAGSLLGLDVNGVLEVTYAYPFPAANKGDADGDSGVEDLDGGEYQIEMMKMLRDINVDNNCVGWYQSMYLGTLNTNDVVDSQYNYQAAEELSDNCVVIMYDPIQSQKGALVIKAYHLSDKFMDMRRNKINDFIRPSEILVEIPLRIKNSGHISAFLRCLKDSHAKELDCSFEALSLSSGDTYMERHLDLIGNWLDELLEEQRKFHSYSNRSAKPRQDHVRWLNKRVQDNIERRENGDVPLELSFFKSGLKPLPDAPPRTESALMLGQVERYCKQVNEHIDESFHKLAVTSQINSAT